MFLRRCLALNRIAAPSLSLDAFFELASSVGIGQVELRNDLGDGSVTDSREAEEVTRAASGSGARVIAINALQKFNLESARPAVERDLEGLVAAARALGCPALVLCPQNDTSDRRSPAECRRETVAALAWIRPVLERAGVTGLVEPLGFPESSLRSGRGAVEAIDESGGGEVFRIVHDTFHHALGPDGPAPLSDPAHVRRVGLIHASGVESSIPKTEYRDAHRVLPGPEDRLDTRGQIRSLLATGYEGPVSFEPFAVEVQRLGPEELGAALESSFRYLLSQ